MTLEELKERMKKINAQNGLEGEDGRICDPEIIHEEIDDLLLEYIGDEEVCKLYNEVSKWYA